MNKRNLWFLTLFSLILVLGIYYVTLPSEIFSDTKTVNSEVEINTTESDKLVALRVERDEKIESVMKELQEKITNGTTKEEKNEAFEELQILNLAKGKELMLEEYIKEEYNMNSLIEIDDNNIKVTLDSTTHDITLANNIMRGIQDKFDSKQYITVKFSD